MAWAIVISSFILGVAYALPKWWMIQAQQNLVQLQIDSLTNNTAASGSVNDGTSTFDFDGPYH